MTDSRLKYTELRELCAMIGIQVQELAKPMGLRPETLYKRTQKARSGARSDTIELALLDIIRVSVGEDAFLTAFSELRLPKELRKNPANTERITWDEAKRILKLCGLQQVEFAKKIDVHQSRVNYQMGWRKKQFMTLKDIKVLKEYCGEKNFELALNEVRAASAART
jgi:predicted DNA-binding protein (UPF0251 family)